MGERLSPEEVRMWFGEDAAVPVSLTDDRFVLGFPPNTFVDWVETNYRRILEEVLCEVTGRFVEVELREGEFALPQHPAAASGAVSEPVAEPADVSKEDAVSPEVSARQQKTLDSLNRLFTFEAFVVGENTRFAYNSCREVAAHPGEVKNPLFIHGPSGLGKTHLLQAIAHEVLSRDPGKMVVYLTSEQFGNLYIDAVRAGGTQRMSEFRQRFRNVDVLLIDDVQFFDGKKGMQEEFFHTFNTLYESGKQIVLTSDRPPREMTQLEDRLRTRFEWGLMVDVAPPDFETRLAIIQNKAAALGVKLPAEVSDYIAENVTSNVRQLEGTLNKILAYRDLLGDQVDEEAVGRAVRDMLLKSNEYVPSPKIIISYVAKYYHLDEDTIRGQSRGRDVVTARQVAIYLIRRMNGLPMNDIGKEFSNRDHTTILHSLQKVEQQMQSDPVFAERVKEITTNINNKR